MAFVRNEEIRLELFNINKRGEVRERERKILFIHKWETFTCAVSLPTQRLDF